MYSIPQLYCPFEAAVNPHFEEVATLTDQWLRSFNLLESEADYQRYIDYQYTKMTARIHPDASFEFLEAASYLYTWLFLVDDALDHVVPKTDHIREANFLGNLVTDFISILKYNHLPHKSEETRALLCSFEDIWRRLVKLTTSTWQCQFTIGFAATFQAAAWEVENIKKNRTASLAAYKQMRPFFSGANLGTDLVEPASGIVLPYYLQHEKTFVAMVDLIRRVICWENDIFSLEKELTHGDNHNVVCVLANEYNISLEDAMIKAAQLHDNDIQLYLSLKETLPTFGEKLDAQVKKYFRAMELMVKGFTDWSLIDSSRYTTI